MQLSRKKIEFGQKKSLLFSGARKNFLIQKKFFYDETFFIFVSTNFKIPLKNFFSMFI